MRLITAVFLSLGFIGFAPVQGWRGIVPLHSSRGDVERLLGPPTKKTSEYAVWYRTEAETVEIKYTTGLPCGIGGKYGQWKVPRDRVESIMVSLLQPVSLSELAIDVSRYKKRSGGHRSEDIYYMSDQLGESIRVWFGEVQEISYHPTRADASLACPGVMQTPQPDCEGLTPPHFDFYQNISFNDEKSRLDNFVINLMREKDRTGYIIAYAGKRARPGEARARAERAKNYLVKVRRFDRNRLKAIDGGYREEPEVELFLVPDGICPPTGAPTIDPRDVTFVKARR